jgi:hypothetical protein
VLSFCLFCGDGCVALSFISSGELAFPTHCRSSFRCPLCRSDGRTGAAVELLAAAEEITHAGEGCRHETRGWKGKGRHPPTADWRWVWTGYAVGGNVRGGRWAGGGIHRETRPRSLAARGPALSGGLATADSVTAKERATHLVDAVRLCARSPRPGPAPSPSPPPMPADRHEPQRGLRRVLAAPRLPEWPRQRAGPQPLPRPHPMSPRTRPRRQPPHVPPPVPPHPASWPCDGVRRAGNGRAGRSRLRRQATPRPRSRARARLGNSPLSSRAQRTGPRVGGGRAVTRGPGD